MKHKHDWRYVSAVYDGKELKKGKKRCRICGVAKGGDA